MWVDAFTVERFGGNPCAVFFDADDLTSAQSLAIAKEMGLSESAFTFKSHKADFGARYFTPAEEIPLAGHPTLATIYSLWKSGRLKLRADRMEVTLELKAGVISVEIHSSDQIIQKIIMRQLKPKFLKIHDAATIAKLFGLSANDLLPQVPVQTVSTGTPQLMIALRDKEALRKVALDIPQYKAYKAESDFFSPHLFCLGGFSETGTTSARHLGIPPDTLEDPFTGSATGGMGAYLWHYGLIKSPKFVAEQGHWMGRPGKAEVAVIGPRENIEAVKVGGSVVEVMRGELSL